MANEFTNDQIVELRTLEKARVRGGGSGFRPEVQELIGRLKTGGVGTPDTTDPFLVQSKVLWDLGWSRELGFKKIDQYRQSLKTDGLELGPERPAGLPVHLNRLVLWDRRPLLVKQGREERVSLVKTCRLCGVAYRGDDDTLLQHEATPEIVVPVRWVWCQDGRMNRNRKPTSCRSDFQTPEVGAEALTGLFLYAQDCTVIGGEGNAWHAVDLPGSIRRDGPSDCAYLRVWSGGPELDWYWDGCALPGCGSASRWE